MAFDVVVIGRVERTLRSVLTDMIGASAITTEEDALVLSTTDQSQLVTVIERLTDLGVSVDEIRRADRPAPFDPATGGSS